MTVAGQWSTARSTQSNREQSDLQSVDRPVDRQTCTLIRASARSTVDCPVDWKRLTQIRSTAQSTVSGQKSSFGQKTKGILILKKMLLNIDQYKT